MSYWINNKTQGLYEVLEDGVINATNGPNNGDIMVLYKNKRGTYVRNKEEFKEKFTPLEDNIVDYDDLTPEKIEEILHDVLSKSTAPVVTMMAWCDGRQAVVKHSSDLRIDDGLCSHADCEVCSEIRQSIKEQIN